MATIEQEQQTNLQKLGRNWVPPASLKTLVEQNRIRISGEDNALLVEIDGATWTLADAYRLSFFR